MRFVVQRVSRASVDVDGARVSFIGPGLLVLAGFGPDETGDSPASPWWRAMLEKLAALRIFPDKAGKMNVSLADAGGHLLLVPQFTLYAGWRKGLRPSFSRAAPPELARALFERLCQDASRLLPGRVRHGVFGADMAVELVNDGPVTLILDSAEFLQ